MWLIMTVRSKATAKAPLIIPESSGNNTVVKFTNILRQLFLYESFMHSLFVLAFWVCTFFGTRILSQRQLLNVGEFDTWKKVNNNIKPQIEL
jgi:hypothetical protein